MITKSLILLIISLFISTNILAQDKKKASKGKSNEDRIENVDNLSVQVDLFAFNSYEKRIYEFKIGRNRIQRNQFERLQHYAREIGARLFVIYLEVPSSKRISFNHIEPIIHKDMAIKRPA